MSIQDSELSPDMLPLGPEVRILKSNQDGLVALEKPTGVMSHPNKSSDQRRSLLTVAYNYTEERYSWNDERGLRRHAWLINRLDSPTSGVILVALNEELCDVIKQQFATHRVSKIYTALVKNIPPNAGGIWNDQLKKDLHRGGRVIKGGQRVQAKSRYQMIKSPTGGFPVSLLKLMPVTGRTHQLRVQCMKHGHPIVGDATYGSFSFNREITAETGIKRLLLHSTETSLSYAYRGEVREFSAKSELPDAFNEVLRFRPGIYHGMPARQTLKDKDTVEDTKPSVLSERRFKQ
ncbi:MAG: RluA family pseudouridine synthase [Coraliomargarita sp.]